MEETKKKKLMDIAGVALVAALVGLGVWMAMDGGEEAAPQENDRKESKESPIDTESTAAGATNAVIAVVATNSIPAPAALQDAVEKHVKAHRVYTNKVAGIQPVKVVMADGSEEVRRKPIFSHKQPLERALATGLMPARSAGGSIVAEMERYTDEQILAWLREPVGFTGEESEKEVQVKLNVQDLKERILDDIANGGNIRDVFYEIDSNACGAAHERRLTKVGLREAVKTGDAELVRAWVDRRNEQLRELGMPEIEVPEEFAEGDEFYNEEEFK